MNKRGGRVELKHHKKPEKSEWASAFEAMQDALELEKQLNQGLLEVDAVASKHGDPELQAFIEGYLLFQLTLHAISIVSTVYFKSLSFTEK